jgi:hypothetical protein
MPCDRRLKPRQTIQQRATEIRNVVDRAAKLLVSGKAKAIVNSQGAIAFSGISDADRDGVTDNCLYRRLLSTGSALALQQIAKAEALAGRKVDRAVVNSGAHSHDGGKTWHSHKG